MLAASLRIIQMAIENGPSSLTEEQLDTVGMLEHLLGKAIADRYFDFCRLCTDALDLRVTIPLAAHALRELDSTLRTVLAVPLDAVVHEEPKDIERLDILRQKLKELGYDTEASQRAVTSIRPRISHREQIARICVRLDLGSDSEVARQWMGLSDNVGGAHKRSFHQALDVDEDFRTRYQRPFDLVVRAVAIALRAQYAALMGRVDQLARMAERTQAAKLFAKEIPGAIPLQRYFFQNLKDGGWLHPLALQGLLGEPLGGDDEDAKSLRFREWPAGEYLAEMAASSDSVVRKQVIEAVSKFASSEMPVVHRYGLRILAALPPEESAPFIDRAIKWMDSGGDYPVQQGSEKLLKAWAVSGHEVEALRIASSLLDFRKEGEKLVSHYGSQLYEAQLPNLATTLVKACGLDAVDLFVRLLVKAGIAGGHLKYVHHNSEPITDDEMATYDVFSALLSVVRRSAEILVERSPEDTRSVVGLFRKQSADVFRRLQLHILALNPAVAPDLATHHLLDAHLVEASWCHLEYASLARAWFPSLSANEQASVLRIVDGIPEKYRPKWHERLLKDGDSLPSAEDERRYEAQTYRDATWWWREVLPPERQLALSKIVEEFGDPNAWKERMRQSEESPVLAEEMAGWSIVEIANYLRSWHPLNGSRQSATALASELRVDVGRRPGAYAEHARRFSDVHPVYARHFFDGLQNTVQNKHKITWPDVLALVEGAFRKLDGSAISDGDPIDDDPTWGWACLSGARLLEAGLKLGAEGLGPEHAQQVLYLVQLISQSVGKQPLLEDFEKRYERDPYFAAESTLRGVSIQLCLYFVQWRAADKGSVIGQSPRQALELLPEVRAILDESLSDRALIGRIPRAILGARLRFLIYYGEQWLRSALTRICPEDDAQLRRSAWLSHLAHDRGPDPDLMGTFKQCYADEIALLPTTANSDEYDYRGKRLAEYLVILYLWHGCAADLLEEFWKSASHQLRQHAMWLVGVRVGNKDLDDAGRARARTYWQRRLSAACESLDRDVFRS